jgi:hypothetical protein
MNREKYTIKEGDGREKGEGRRETADCPPLWRGVEVILIGPSPLSYSLSPNNKEQ